MTVLRVQQPLACRPCIILNARIADSVASTPPLISTRRLSFVCACERAHTYSGCRVEMAFASQCKHRRHGTRYTAPPVVGVRAKMAECLDGQLLHLRLIRMPGPSANPSMRARQHVRVRACVRACMRVRAHYRQDRLNAATFAERTSICRLRRQLSRVYACVRACVRAPFTRACARTHAPLHTKRSPFSVNAEPF